MLETLTNIITELTARIGATVDSTFFTPTKIKEVAIQSYNWAVSLYEWPMLETAKVTTTTTGQYYYDYPDGFMTDSVFRVIVDGVKYDLKNFDDFLDYKHITTGIKDLKISADYGKQIFLYPTPTEDGKDIIIFGLQNVVEIGDDDKTIFTDSDIMGNEAVVKRGLGILLAQANLKKEGQAEDAEALAMLANLYSKVLKRKAKYQRLDKAMFEVPDFFEGNGQGEQTTGNFNL